MLVICSLIGGRYHESAQSSEKPEPGSSVGCARALGHFEAAIQAGLPGGETRLLGPVRIRQQLDAQSVRPDVAG